MTRIFVAGPIDFQRPADVVDYRLDIGERLRESGFTPVDQYTELLQLLADIEFERQAVTELLSEGDLPDEPFLDAIYNAVAATSVERVLDDPGIVPDHTPEDVVRDIVNRDFDILGRSEALLAYLPRPSCGTMAEIIRANELDPPVVVAERPPHYVQYYADAVVDSIEEGVQQVDTRL